MTITAAAIRELAKRLIEEHRLGHSWRKIAGTFPRRADGSQVVKAGTLCRIASEAGEWIPKDREILIALGLVKPRSKQDDPEWLSRRSESHPPNGERNKTGSSTEEETMNMTEIRADQIEEGDRINGRLVTQVIHREWGVIVFFGDERMQYYSHQLIWVDKAATKAQTTGI